VQRVHNNPRKILAGSNYTKNYIRKHRSFANVRWGYKSKAARISQFENYEIKNDNIKPTGDFNFRVDTEINSPVVSCRLNYTHQRLA
jgi:hypothetical protein